MKTLKTRLRVIAATLCSMAVLQVHAVTVRYYGEGSVPDPQVVANILGGAKPGHGLKMRGSSVWNAPVAEAVVRDGGQNLSDDSTTLREERINANAQLAVDDWRQRRAGGGKPSLALADTPSAARTPAAAPVALALAVTFANDSAQIPPAATASLAAVAEGIRIAGFDRRIVIEGHTSASGSLKHNMRLARLRAESVKRYLVTQFGIPGQALLAVGMGPKSPLNRQDPNAAENRRVQFRVAA